MQVLTAIEHDAAGGRVDAGDLAHQHREVASGNLVTQDVADGAGNRRCGQASRGHLVEQGLEQVVVGAVDDDDFDIGMRQRLGRFQTTKTATNDDHARFVANRNRCLRGLLAGLFRGGCRMGHGGGHC